MTGTARLALPLLSPGQAQKESSHNEALQVLDALVAGAVEEGPRSSPPASPIIGACYIVGASPTGTWSGRPDHVACYTSGGWRLLPPLEGMSVYVKTATVWANYRSGAWEVGAVRGSGVVIGGQQVVGARQAGIASPAGGTTVDTQARGAIDQILACLRQHGLIDS